MSRNYYLSKAIGLTELYPADGRNSFYGKAIVKNYPNGDRALFSYNTLILVETAKGKTKRYWEDYSATTGRHVIAFNGMNKKAYEALKVEA